MLRKLAGVLVLGTAFAGTPMARAQVPAVPIVGYEIHTTYRAPDGTFVPTAQNAVLLVPSLVDVDHNAATGVAGMDLLVELSLGAVSLTLRTLQLLPDPAPALRAPSPMPVKVEVVVADPRPGSSLRIALGYDALADTAPVAYDATFAIAGAGRGSAFTLDLRTVRPGTTLGTTAAVFEAGPGGARVNPKSGRIDFTPVPASAHVGIGTADTPATEQLALELTTDTPTRTVLGLEDVQGPAVTRADGVIDRLPASLSLVLAREPTGRQSGDYNAAGRVAVLDMGITQRTGGVLRQELALSLRDMATQASFVQDTPTHATFRANSPIGVLELGIATGGAIRRLPDPSYLYQDDRGGVRSVVARVLGLEAFELSSADPYLLDATVRQQPFRILRIQGATTLDASVRDLPHRVRLTFSPGAGTVSYTGSSVIGEVTLDFTDPAGISRRATQLHLVARGVPTSLELSFSQTGGSVSLDARGGTLGLIEVQLTSGPDRRLDPSVDGVLLEDLADRYVVFARITGLRRIVATQGPPPDITLDTTGGRVFVLDLNQLKGAKVEYVRATLDRLVPSIRVQFVESPGRQEVIYTASAPTNGLTIDTNSGDRWNLHAFLGNPLPASARFCAAGDGYCTGFREAARAGSFAFEADRHTTIDVFDCQRPLVPSCTAAPSRYTRVNLHIRHLEADADFSNFGERGHIFMNTTNAQGRHTMNGFILNENGSGGGFRANFPLGFSANNRRGSWTLFGLFKNKTGLITCPSGTSLQVRVLGFWIGVTSFLC